MFKNYLKTAFRNSWRQKGYTFINIIGLSIGLACSFFILLWVRDELSYDRFHEHGDRIYRVWRNVNISGQIYTWYATPGPLGGAIKAEFPEVENAVYTFWDQMMLITTGDQTYREQGTYAGPDFFEVFTFPLIQGDPRTVLQGDNSVVISERLAEKLYGKEWQTQGDVLGKSLTVDHRKDFTITGVAANVPKNSSIKFDVLLPAEDYFQRLEWSKTWGNNSFPLYLRLQEGTSQEAFNAKIADIITRHHEGSDEVVFLQPYEDIYLHSYFKDGNLIGGRIEYVRIFSIIAIFLLLIASINFMNLATARSAQRSREIGVRKSVGANKRALVFQFLAESVLLALVAFLFALLLVVGMLSSFNGLTGKSLTFSDLNGNFLLGVFAIALFVGLISGSYPALYLSSFNPIAILRGTFQSRPGNAILRKGLVIFQFALSVLLIVSTIAIYLQIQFIRDKNLGMDRENLVYLNLEGNIQSQYDAFKDELLKQPGISGVTTANMNPLQIGSNTTDPTWEGKDPDDQRLFYILSANYDFVETMKMEMAAGRTFSKSFPTDTANFIINEETAKAMGGSDVVGKTLEMWGRKGQIIGVVKNFTMNSLYNPIAPTIILLNPKNTWMLYVRTSPGQTQQALEALEATYHKFNPGYPFEYTFLDQTFENTYKNEMIMGKLANIFAILAVFVSCLGLFGLASFTAEQRMKEIGIRKVLGASVPRLVIHLTSDFTKLVLLGILIAIPVAFYIVQEWLGRFTYRMELGYGIFIAAGLIALVIAWLTVSYQSVKAAVINPVNSLRSE